MSISRRVGSGATFQIAARVFSATVALVVTAIVLARTMDPAEYGRFNFWHTLFLLALTFVDFGANRAAIRLIAAGVAPRDATIEAARRLKTIVGAAAFAAMAALALAIEDGLASKLLLALAAAHALSHGLGAGSVPFEVEVDFRVPAQSVALGAATFLILGLLLAAAGAVRAEPFLIAYALGLTVQNAYLWFRAKRALRSGAASDQSGAVGTRADPTGTDRHGLQARLFREALPLGLSAAAIAVYYYCDTLLLRPLRGEEDVARYSVAYRLMTFALMAPVLFSQVLFPVFTRCAATSRELLDRTVRRATFYLAYAAAAIAAPLLALGGPILALVFGERYRGEAPTLSMLTFALVVVFLLYPHTTALIAAGRAATFTRITVTCALLDVLLNLAFVPTYGPVGAAATTVATEGFVLIAAVISLRRHFGACGFSRSLLRPLATFVVSFAVLRWLAESLPLGALLAIGAALPLALAVPLRVLPFRLGVEEAELR